MKLEAIRNEVELLIQDASYDADTIDSYINDALALAAGQINLPTLKRLGTVDTVIGQAWVSMTTVSSDFSGFLRRVKTSDGGSPKVYPDLERMMDDYGNMDAEGAVEAVTLEGSTVWYAKIPTSAETLTLLYFENPSRLTKDDDEPVDIPPHVRRKLLAHGAAFMIFDQIEDGVEGQKVNTSNHFFHAFDNKNRDSGITMLREWVARTQPHHISSLWRY